MNAMTALAQRAYAPAAAAAETPREIEYRAFAHVTGLLKRARDGADGIGGYARLAEAMHENVRLWSTIAEDCASDGNALPKPLRAQIVGLAIFARNHMGLVLKKTATVDPLIEVNMAIMRGLRGPDAAAPGEARG